MVISFERCSRRTARGRCGEALVPKRRTARNAPTTIRGRDSFVHALDQLQSRGILPSVVEDAIQNGDFMVGKTSVTSAFYSPVNDLTIITNMGSGRVATAVLGLVKQ
ncbi:hypothetical protein [Streptomyces sp. NPDC004592]